MLSRDDGSDRSADVVAAAQRLSSLVVASREEDERIRRVPSHVVEAQANCAVWEASLREAGLLGLARIVGRVEVGHSDRSHAAQLDYRVLVAPLVMVHALRKVQVTAGV